MKTIVLALLPALYLSACAPSREAAREPAARGNQDPLGKFESDFRPSDHDTIAPPPAPHPGAPSAWKKGDTAGAVSATDTVGELVPGFRVQIYSTTDIDQAKAKKLEAEGDFPTEWFYLQYDPPTYKIRGGNFLQRYEAERFVRLAVDRGFSDSWAVPEKVFSQPPPVNR